MILFQIMVLHARKRCNHMANEKKIKLSLKVMISCFSLQKMNGKIWGAKISPQVGAVNMRNDIKGNVGKK